MEISTPAIKLWDRIVILPVVGVVDSFRAQQMMNTMLSKIMETAAKVIILDIQGVAAVDTAVANHLIKIAKATKLMGCRCIISGISPAVAETLVQLGIELGDVATNSTLQDALSDAFQIVNLMVIPQRTGRFMDEVHRFRGDYGIQEIEDCLVSPRWTTGVRMKTG